MTTTTAKGARVYELLVPFSIPGGDGIPAQEITAITLAPPTLATTLKWQDGRYDHPDGMVFGLIEELTGFTMKVIGQLRYPDADLFMAEVMQHLPPAVRESIASGQYPMPAATRAPYTAPAAGGPQAAPQSATDQPEEIFFDPNHAAMPLTDEERSSIPDGSQDYGMDLGDGGRD